MVYKDGMDVTDLHREYTFLTENTIFLKTFFYLLLIYRYIEVSNYDKLYMIMHLLIHCLPDFAHMQDSQLNSSVLITVCAS